jgi:hypothetical protein
MFHVSHTSTYTEVKTVTGRKMYYPMKAFVKIKVKIHIFLISA